MAKQTDELASLIARRFHGVRSQIQWQDNLDEFLRLNLHLFVPTAEAVVRVMPELWKESSNA